jgi:hypothetical protein
LGFVDFLTDFCFQDVKIANFLRVADQSHVEWLRCCVHFPPAHFDVKVFILFLYLPEKKSYSGFIPNEQNGYVERLRRVIQQSNGQQMGQNPVSVQNIQRQQKQQGGPRPMMAPADRPAEPTRNEPGDGPMAEHGKHAGTRRRWRHDVQPADADARRWTQHGRESTDESQTAENGTIVDDAE